ncbi:MarR family winged helix-turn-helix transcriptional regulator [Pseudovibrio hongkongensis]|uniref:MarR family winged helix-turn-helix transcriptional regulator n=1 Tax=Polycladidibacter hongkongensis TaxID=1647556 RepID=UPI00082BEAF9
MSLTQGQGNCCSFSEFCALRVVASYPDCAQQQIVSELALTKSAACRIVRRLEERGLLRISASAQDARVHRLALTSAGQTLLESHHQADCDRLRGFFQSLPDDEIPKFSKKLSQLLACFSPKSSEEEGLPMAKLSEKKQSFSAAPCYTPTKNG